MSNDNPVIGSIPVPDKFIVVHVAVDIDKLPSSILTSFYFSSGDVSNELIGFCSLIINESSYALLRADDVTVVFLISCLFKKSDIVYVLIT
jgi:hypothetical protein